MDAGVVADIEHQALGPVGRRGCDCRRRRHRRLGRCALGSGQSAELVDAEHPAENTASMTPITNDPTPIGFMR